MKRKVQLIHSNGNPVTSVRINPNDECACNSGLKAKKCCGTETKFYAKTKRK